MAQIPEVPQPGPLSIVQSPNVAFGWSFSDILNYLEGQYQTCLELRRTQIGSDSLRKCYAGVCEVYETIICPSVDNLSPSPRFNAYVPRTDKDGRNLSSSQEEDRLECVYVQGALGRTVVITDFFSALAFIINIMELSREEFRSTQHRRTLCRYLLMVFCKLCWTIQNQFFSHARDDIDTVILGRPPTVACVIYRLPVDIEPQIASMATVSHVTVPESPMSSEAGGMQSADSVEWCERQSLVANLGCSLPGTSEMIQRTQRTYPRHDSFKKRS